MHVQYAKYAGKLGRTSAGQLLVLGGSPHAETPSPKTNPFLEAGCRKLEDTKTKPNPYELVQNAMLGNLSAGESARLKLALDNVEDLSVGPADSGARSALQDGEAISGGGDSQGGNRRGVSQWYVGDIVWGLV